MKFLPNLTLLFIYLELTNQIDWSWIFILAPVIIGLILHTIKGIFDENEKRKNVLKNYK